MDFDYKVFVTDDAEADLDRFIKYLIEVKMNKQAARNVLDDYDATIERLSIVAGSLKLVDDEDLANLGYRKIRFMKHRYFLLYRVEDDTAIVDAIFHDLQDYENVFKEQHDIH
ncbi:Plasmid stabilization system protein ParE [Butyrivibrio sp. ob235]|uniref:type II toxin-antitoxin system RelE/ParE family toxin n=1 Tax=Butyrivibrio sp. ob235 TaxID=1761780 RepID=UPI0008C3388E|nr:type II toxin-antitoxin system RelE/ParE family toxin [Butyrivibrio sp. ob235]SEM44958.1 Plasmid stabilization system protein ParE [Butyrivibrio sp. ob235]